MLCVANILPVYYANENTRGRERRKTAKHYVVKHIACSPTYMQYLHLAVSC